MVCVQGVDTERGDLLRKSCSGSANRRDQTETGEEVCGLLNRRFKVETQPIMTAAAPDGGTVNAAAQEFEPEAHSAVLVDATHSDVMDCGELARMKRRWRKKRKSNTGFLNPVFAVGTTVSGNIEAKIDSAYLISVVVGGEKLKGVLYHVSPKRRVNQFAGVTTSPLGEQARDIKSKNGQSGSLRRRRRKFLTKDRNAPKKNRTGYNYFFAEERIRLKEAYPDMRSEREISQSIAEAWNSLSQKDREPYQIQGVKDKERYQKEKSKYVGQGLYKLEPLNLDGPPLCMHDGGEAQEEDTKAYGSMCIEEDGSEPLAMEPDTLLLEDQVGNDGESTKKVSNH